MSKTTKLRIRKCILLFLLLLLPVLLCACGEDEQPKPVSNDPIVTAQDSVADVYNKAVQALSEAGSYKMTGSVTSVAEVMPDGSQTVNVSPIECLWEGGRMQVTDRSTVDPHSTYFDGDKYYCLLEMAGGDLRYFTTTNDHNDFSAADYLRTVNAEILSGPVMIENADGSKELSFEIPFAIYDSPALQGWLGYIVDETHEARTLSIAAKIDKDGHFTEFSMDFINDVAFGEQTIHQEIAVTMTLQDYAAVRVAAPEDLTAYEDWSLTGDPGDSDWAENLTPEDME